MIKIIDYGLGNMLAFQNLYRRINIDAALCKSADELRDCSKLILPGVGAFDRAMQLLEASGMRPVLDELVLGAGVPVMGVCLGMQLLARSSEEGELPGLGWVDGQVKTFRSSQCQDMLLPHMGWNDVQPTASGSLFKQIAPQATFYFLHSYYFHCEQVQHVAATTHYGVDFCSAVQHKNIYGVQFHPEKSHHCGVQLLKNFAEL
jgi:imidazole glycerol-phosphate synthase subunit HisH